jgi:hypothetical protein
MKILTQSFSVKHRTVVAMMKQQHKRKPFGKSTENALNARVGGAGNPRGVSNNGAKEEMRRDSKTPKAGNLTSTGGAYALKKELEAIEPRGKGRRKRRDGQYLPRRTAMLDPSPVKRPDPSTKSSTVQLSKMIARPVDSTKRNDSTKQKEHGGFVAASLKRLFPSSNQNGNGHSIGPSSPTLTASSTPEKDSPLITSPCMKPDPIAKGDDVKGAIDVVPQVPKPVPIPVPKNDGHADEKRILDVMLKSSSGGPSRRPAPPLDQQLPDASLDSLVGSIVGVTSLQRMESADESEVTTAGYFPREDSSQASMTTRFDREEEEESAHNVGGLDLIHQQRVFRGKSSSNAAPYHRELRHANVFDEDGMTVATQQQIHLPAGWQVRWSKTKQQQYWVHPDFGSTWHCPGLITNNDVRYQATARSELLYDDQKITQGMPIRHSANPPPRPSSTIVPNQSTTFNSTFNDEYQTSAGCYLQRSEAEEAVARGAKNAESLDVPSSADVSTKCFTQDFETHGNDHGVDDDAKGVTDNCHDNPVEFEYDQRQDDGEDASSRQLSYNDQEDGFDDNQDDGGVSIPDIMNANRQDASSPNDSLVSDGVDVAALLQNGERSKYSPLAAIEEYSPGSNASSCKVGFTDGSKSHVRSFNDESSIDASVDFGASNGMDDDGAVSSNDDRDGHESDDCSPPRVMAMRKEQLKSSRSHSIGSKKKYVPPGPLCSLQFLEEIEKKEFDTPLWRRMKRKRSTLSSAQKSRRRQSH